MILPGFLFFKQTSKHPTGLLQLKVEVLPPLVQMFVQYTQKKSTLLTVNVEVGNPRGKMSHGF